VVSTVGADLEEEVLVGTFSPVAATETPCSLAGADGVPGCVVGSSERLVDTLGDVDLEDGAVRPVAAVFDSTGVVAAVVDPLALVGAVDASCSLTGTGGVPDSLVGVP